MQRFFLSPEFIEDDRVVFPKHITHQLKTVMRLSPGSGQTVIVLDNTGMEREVVLDGLSDGLYLGRVTAMREGRKPPELKLTLAFSLTKREKVETILQKGTELGVCAFQPFVSSRSLVHKLNGDPKQPMRWERIMREAAEQCERSTLPVLLPTSSFEKIIKAEWDAAARFLAGEKADPETDLIRGVLGESNSAVLVVGPEGGFSAAEVELAREQGWRIVSLGRSILRMETACIAGAAILLHQSEL